MFNVNLKNRREACGLSQKQVADYLNISPQSISKWEKGSSLPSINYLPKLAACLMCDINYFFLENNKEKIDALLLNTFMKLMIEEIYHKTTNSEASIIFMREHPSVINEISSLLSNLKEYQTLRPHVLQRLLMCPFSDANRFLNYLVDGEMVEKLGNTNKYFVIKDNIDGFVILLKTYDKLA